jgi:hypothetical protein
MALEYPHVLEGVIVGTSREAKSHSGDECNGMRCLFVTDNPSSGGALQIRFRTPGRGKVQSTAKLSAARRRASEMKAGIPYG